MEPAKSKSFPLYLLDRLYKAEGDFGTIQYGYDETGNRTVRTDSAGTDTYTYSNGTSRLVRIDGPSSKAFYYDSNGRVSQIEGKRYVYNANGRLSLILQAGQPVASYTYDIFDRRIKKSARGSVTHFHYDIDDNLIAETDANGSLLKAYIWLDGMPVAMVKADGSIYYYHNDHLGTPQKMTNENGALVWAADYLPFGEADVTIETIENNLRFKGQYFDSETGFHYNYHRYYDPSTGRYLTPDPIGLEGGINLYAYASNNPINLIDPLGLSIWKKGFLVIKALGNNRKIVAKVKAKNVQDAVKKVSSKLDNIDTRTGAKQVVQTPNQKSRDALSKALSPDGKMRGPERSGGGYPEHTHPNTGKYKNVHIESILSAIVPYSYAMSDNENTTPNDIIAGAAWDIASTIDPIFITDFIEWILDLEPSIYQNCE
ncbi:MAG: RHS repeat-associated core domain-containing protein [Desulfobacteraceae bacterium]